MNDNYCLKLLLEIIMKNNEFSEIYIYSSNDAKELDSLRFIVSSEGHELDISIVSDLIHDRSSDELKHYYVHSLNKYGSELTHIIYSTNNLKTSKNEQGLEIILDLLEFQSKKFLKLNEKVDYLKNIIEMQRSDSFKLIDNLIYQNNIFHFIYDDTEHNFYGTNNLFNLLGFSNNRSSMTINELKCLMDEKDSYNLAVSVNSLLNNEVRNIKLEVSIIKTNERVMLYFFKNPYLDKDFIIYGYFIFLRENNFWCEFGHQERDSFSDDKSYGVWEYDVESKDLSLCATAKTILGFKNSSTTITEFIELNPKINYIAVRKLVKYLKLLHLDKLKHFTLQLKIINFIGEEKYIDVIGRKISNLYPEDAIVGIIRDVSLQRLEETSILQLERLQSLGSLAGGIAHDFNNILMATFGYIGMLKKVSNLPNEALYYINGIESVSKAASILAKRLLTFTRHEDQNADNINIVHIVSEGVEIVRHLMPANIEVNYSYDYDDIYVIATASDIQNMIMNFAINSKDAMKEGGILNINVTSRFIEEIDDGYLHKENFIIGDYVVIEITDSGIGFKESEAGRIFTPFYTTKAKNSGTGLGLSIIIKTINKYGGLLKYRSVVNVGTTFTVFLPISYKHVDYVEEISIAGEIKDEKIDPSDYMIMVVDDEEVVKSIITEALIAVGFNVVSFSHPLEAIRYYKNEYSNIDLVILDMMMPIMSGEHTFANLKEINKDVLVLILSGYTNEGVIQKMLSDGAVDYLNKPISIDDLTSKVIRVLNSNSRNKIIDEKLALSTLDNNKKVYDKLLIRYYREYHNANEKIISYLADGDYLAIKQLIHKIKGVSLNIGAEDLYDICYLIEETIIDDINVDLANIQINAFITHHSLVIDRIKEMIY